MKLTNGEWLNFEPEKGDQGGMIRVRGLYNADHSTAIAVAHAAALAAAGVSCAPGDEAKEFSKLAPEVREAVEIEVIWTLLNGWRNMTDEDDKPIADHVGRHMGDAEKATARKLYDGSDLVRASVFNAALAVSRRYADYAKGFLGNSKAVPSGTSGTADT
jgi:hypothetical protein